jgi:hypothetical protein
MAASALAVTERLRVGIGLLPARDAQAGGRGDGDRGTGAAASGPDRAGLLALAWERFGGLDSDSHWTRHARESLGGPRRLRSAHSHPPARRRTLARASTTSSAASTVPTACGHLCDRFGREAVVPSPSGGVSLLL